jgi:hypothetical protein
VTLYLKQVVFSNPFQNPKEAFLLQNPSFLYNKLVFQKPNPNIFSKLISKIFKLWKKDFIMKILPLLLQKFSLQTGTTNPGI